MIELEKVEYKKDMNIIKDIVDVHIKSFPNFFLTFLGSNFLFLLYKMVSKEKNGILIVAKDSNKVVGFVAGVIDQYEFFKKLVFKYKWKFAFTSVKAILKKPKILARLLRALKRSDESIRYSSKTYLMSIAVHPAYQGRGIGKILIEELFKEVIKKGGISVCLTTDKNNNDKVNKFYINLGFKLVRSYKTPEGREMNEYFKSLI